MARERNKIKVTVQIGKKKMVIYDNDQKANIVFPDEGKRIEQNTLFASELCRIADSLKAYCMSKVTKH